MQATASPSDVLAFDIGGANLKAADGRGWTHAAPFPLWLEHERLAAALGRLVADRRPRRIVATMTGEIADCYAGRADGVRRIVAALEAAAGAAETSPEVGVYLVDGGIVSPAEACRRPLAAAAANWHAMARLAGRRATASRALAIDVGSTTTDIIPLVDGVPAALECDDVGRMASGELVYTGVERTPVAAIVRTLPWPSAGPGRRPIASERYADARDAWLLLDGLPEDAAATDTADGRPATKAAAAARLARMLLADPDAFHAADALAAATWCGRAQARQVARSLRRLAATLGWRPECIVLSGHGTCLAERALAEAGWRADTVRLPETLGPGIARAACAHALALIARGELR